MRLSRTPPDRPKAGSERLIALDDGTVEVLREHRRRQRDLCTFLGVDPDTVTSLFLQPDGLPLHPDFVTRHFARVVKAAGLPPIRLHDLRHGAATLALASSVAMKVVQEMLGHSSITITADTYTSVLPQVARAAAQSAATLIPRRAQVLTSAEVAPEPPLAGEAGSQSDDLGSDPDVGPAR